MARHITTVILVHVARRWRTFHRRHMLLALGEALPEDAALVCVDRPITPDVTLWKYPARFWTGIWRVREEEDGGRVRVVTLRLAAHDITADRIPALQAVNRWLARRQLRRYLRTRFPEARRVIQWIYHPVQRWLFDALPETGRVYECYDEYCRTPEGEWVTSRWRKEEPLLREADLTLATSMGLTESRRHMARRIAYSPNGVPEFFFEVGGTPPDPIDVIPHPRIIYLGNLRPPVDIEFLALVFRRRPDWQLVFVGPVDRAAAVASLRARPNVHFLGSRPYEQIPSMLRRSDAGLIPFKINEFSRALNPLKTWEYLACGLPVAASELPELRSLGDLVHVAVNDAAAFERAIEAALAMDRFGHARRAVATARAFSWSAIVRRSVMPELQRVFQVGMDLTQS